MPPKNIVIRTSMKGTSTSSLRKKEIGDKVDRTIKLSRGQCNPASQQIVQSISVYEEHEDKNEWLLQRLAEANSGVSINQKKHYPLYRAL